MKKSALYASLWNLYTGNCFSSLSTIAWYTFCTLQYVFVTLVWTLLVVELKDLINTKRKEAHHFFKEMQFCDKMVMYNHNNNNYYCKIMVIMIMITTSKGLTKSFCHSRNYHYFIIIIINFTIIIINFIISISTSDHYDITQYPHLYFCQLHTTPQ